MPELLTAEELADRLKVSPRTVKEWARAGRIPEVRLSAKVRRFLLTEVIRVMPKSDAEFRQEVVHAD